MSRTKNALKFVASSAWIQIVIVICGFILVPLIIKEYGSEVNGLVNTIRQLITYFSVVSLGLGAASQVALYKPLSDKNWFRVNEILAATRVFFNRTGYVFATLILISAFLFPFLSDGNVSSLTILSIILIVGIGSISEYIIISKYRILLAADQKQYVISNIQSQGIIITTVLSVILIYFHASIVAVQAAATLSYLIRLLFTVRYVKKKYPEVTFNVKPDFEALSERWQAFFYQISGMVISYSPLIIVASFCGFNDASVFSVYNMIFFSLAMITAIFSSGFSASFGNLLAKKEEKLLNKSFETYEFIYRNVMFFSFTCALILVVPFISVYIKNDDGVNYLIPTLGLAFGFSGILKSIRTPFVTLVEAAGLFKENNVLNILEALLNVVLSILFVLKWSVLGVLIASIISGTLRSIIFILFVDKNILNKKSSVYFLKIILNIAVVILLYKTFNDIVVTSYLEWIVEAIKVAFICMLSFFTLNSVVDFAPTRDVFHRIRSLS